MEEIVFMCVIFLFLVLIYNHFNKIREGMGQECDLSGFRKKQPAEINQMSAADKATYNCQLKVYNNKIYSKEEMNKVMTDTKEKIEKYKNTKKNRLQKLVDKLNKYWPKYLDEKKKQKVAVTKLVGYVCPSEDKSVEKYCDKQKGGEDEDEVDVDVEEEGGKRAVRDERRGPDPKLHKSQGTLVDKQEKEADGKASE